MAQCRKICLHRKKYSTIRERAKEKIEIKNNARSLLFDKKDTKENRRAFLEWMQHENQKPLKNQGFLKAGDGNRILHPPEKH